MINLETMNRRAKTLLFIIFGTIILALAISPSFQSRAKSLFTRTTTGISIRLENFSHRVRRTFSFWTNISELKKQNEELSRKIISLQVDSSQIEELKNENALLKKELGFIEPSEIGTLVPAKIIERDAATFSDEITIDKGEKDGIVKGVAVVSNNILIGTIKNVMSDTSKILLITSKDSIIQAMLQNSRSKGILRGGISGLYLDDITTDTTYKIGENVVTSGLGGDIMSGMLIGTAGKLESASSSIFKTISVEPLVDISSLELVFVKK
ncbi:rod shape-determining protein MreC [Candidatus Berkelbacteria bacterium CG10_big_fil_rev_8_21_14_0_10_43_13]|uniref:Cell shape-determining protein MreC n=1 Tax=Candidatus Berkelbacteria bacterium CG10_big_fil_rev_8_21_14_0_10_43_13 TaxID=1974514 RepID=A0A2H0W700_9BACT|nr:MAG: rod shape-determining protein MreC [Candidatus Berkelbacteria bacterium CG10_big_fil_rev_8_21_14_0_10_43_13]